MPLSAKSRIATAILMLSATVAAQSSTAAPASTTAAAAAAAAPSFTAVSGCHAHGTVQYCMYESTEYQVVGPTKTEELEAQYTDCHSHGTDTFCMKSDGGEVKLVVEVEETAESGHEEEHDHAGQNCHFHAGVEHCVGASETEGERQCGRTDRNYNVPLRVGLLFVILGTSAIGVFGPVLTASFTRWTTGHILFVILKQFGTGVVISTAFVHLLTHASLMFTNECLGELAYEATTAAIFMAGIFLSFAIEYLGARFVLWRQKKSAGAPPDTEATRTTTVDNKSANDSNTSTQTATTSHTDDRGTHTHMHGYAEEQLGVMVLEAGVIFHSLLIGLTLVVAGDSFFLTLFAVLLFHQMFEGIALGTCIAGLSPKTTSLTRKFLMATAFALITPLGMAIGIGVLHRFNGNDPSTLIAIGTLDALSAGILAWVVRTAVGMVSLVAGMVGMSVLGKWA
ncbi:ZIP zinc transporter-domain-containing protein [Lophiotrema nucula]|uniref:ZIP zinc transporter-domain-containing protein n=1 Tax=Lophiotrema nucula TaxID=690887 RepID=A0A6A5Z4C9_9PLEO|nr:ZIP zinc transporter-domain-containing protein [Lophiotrema nucula]